MGQRQPRPARRVVSVPVTAPGVTKPAAIANPLLYTDPVTGATHTYATGDTVILAGDLAALAKKSGYAPLGKLGTVDATTGAASILLFTPGEPTQEGGIGIAAVQHVVPSLVNNVRPLPFQFSTPNVQVITHNSQIFTCARTSDTNPAGCDSCDPSGQSFPPETYADRLNQVFNSVTEVRGGPGATRYTLFACPATIIRSGQPVSVANNLCKTVIVATITGSTNTNRYSLISTMDPTAFKAAFLYTYGLPVDDVSYYRAVQWSRIPEYQQLQQQSQGERIACTDVDAGWLDQHIRELLAKGFEAKEISLLAGGGVGAGAGGAATRLITRPQQQAFQSLVV